MTRVGVPPLGEISSSRHASKVCVRITACKLEPVMTRTRLVATDLDGTALRTDGTISPRTAAAFARVEEAGATLVFVTGRPPRWMHTVAGAVRHRGLAICANGALVYDLHTEEIVEAHLIAPDIL